MLQIRPLTLELAALVKELNEDQIQLEKDVADIKKWIEEDPSLRGIPSDQYIVNCLRARRYDVEVVKRKYKANIKARTDLGYIFHNRDIHDEDFQYIVQQGAVLTMHNPLKADDATYVIFRPKTFKVDYCNLEDFSKPNTTIYDITSNMDDNFAICGYVAIIDCSDVGLRTALHVKWSFIRKILIYMQKTSPFIIKQIHIINVPYVLKFLINLMYNFVSYKTKYKIHFHWGYEELYEYVSREILPKEYGGYGPTIDEIIQRQIKFNFDNEDLLAELDNLYVDKSKYVTK